jgi:hypothetical protein
VVPNTSPYHSRSACRHPSPGPSYSAFCECAWARQRRWPRFDATTRVLRLITRVVQRGRHAEVCLECRDSIACQWAAGWKHTCAPEQTRPADPARATSNTLSNTLRALIPPPPESRCVRSQTVLSCVDVECGNVSRRNSADAPLCETALSHVRSNRSCSVYMNVAALGNRDRELRPS